MRECTPQCAVQGRAARSRLWQTPPSEPIARCMPLAGGRYMSLLSALSPTAPIALGGSAFGAPSEDSQEGSRRYRERLLATAIAGPQQRHLALAAIIVSALAFAAAAPFAQLLLMPVAAFIPAYEAALVLI